MKKYYGVGRGLMDIMKLCVSMPHTEETVSLVEVWSCRMRMPQVKKHMNVMNVGKPSLG